MTCVECDIPQLARNNYFTGKLLVERDFTDEQRYVLGKLRRHNRYLHGWGVACGLEILQHANPACRTQYVMVDPGVAVDCCGREIVVPAQEMVDLRALIREAWRRDHGPESDVDDQPHTVRLCLGYRECATEDVPALFDECGCEPDGCRPNRILDSHEYSVVLDPPPAPANLYGLELAWHSTIGAANAGRFAVDPAAKRLYVLGSNADSVYVFDTETGALLTSRPLPAAGLDVAVSADGSRVFVAVAAAPSAAAVVLVLDAASLVGVVNTLPLTPESTGTVRLAVSPADGRLAVLDSAGKTVVTWSAAVEQTGADPATSRLGDVAVPATSTTIRWLPDGGALLVANPADVALQVIPVATPNTVNSVSIGVKPIDLAVAGTTAGPRVLVLDGDTPALSLWKADLTQATPFLQLGTTVALPDAPVDVVGAEGGRWWLLLSRDAAAGAGVVRIVDAHAIETGTGTVLGDPTPVGTNPAELVWIGDEERLYGSFTGPVKEPAKAGVAVLDLAGGDCGAALEPGPCPACDDDCIPLVTVAGWKAGDDFTDATLDNHTDRPVLPSVHALSEAVRCLIAQRVGTGKPGVQGPPGPQGNPGNDGAPGPGAPVLKLPRITAINWKHNSTYTSKEFGEFLNNGLVVAFDTPIASTTLTPFTVELYVREVDKTNGRYQWVGLPLQIAPVKVDDTAANCGAVAKSAGNVEQGQPCTGVLFVPKKDAPRRGDFLVLLYGDGILAFDKTELDGVSVQLCLDGNHLAPGLQGKTSARCPTGDGVEGGTFRSWFTVTT
jgi:DNA-binding beta-propeller fold protein YncE